MKSISIFVAGGLALSMMVLAGTAMADDGVGACAAGNGVSIGIGGLGAFVGVNAGTNSATGIYDNQADYETQCCAETGSPPDCFTPVGE